MEDGKRALDEINDAFKNAKVWDPLGLYKRQDLAYCNAMELKRPMACWTEKES